MRWSPSFSRSITEIVSLNKQKLLNKYRNTHETRRTVGVLVDELGTCFVGVNVGPIVCFVLSGFVGDTTACTGFVLSLAFPACPGPDSGLTLASESSLVRACGGLGGVPTESCAFLHGKVESGGLGGVEGLTLLLLAANCTCDFFRSRPGGVVIVPTVPERGTPIFTSTLCLLPSASAITARKSTLPLYKVSQQ